MSENKLLVLKNSQEATNYYGTKYSVFLPWFFALLIKGKAQKSLFMLLCNIAGIWLENKGKGHYLGNTQSPIDERPIAQIEMLERCWTSTQSNCCYIVVLQWKPFSHLKQKLYSYMHKVMPESVTWKNVYYKDWLKLNYVTEKRCKNTTLINICK